VVVGIDRLGRNAAEVMTTIRDLGERGIVQGNRAALAA
jgi:DNA invertase Pin-like site-specific DNA recombinase